MGRRQFELAVSFFLSFETLRPVLVVTSAEGCPTFISPMESHVLKPGLAEYACCEKRKERPMGTTGGCSAECERYLVCKSMGEIIDRTASRLFARGTPDSLRQARTIICLKKYYLRGFNETESKNGEGVSSHTSKRKAAGLVGLKQALRWNDTSDCYGAKTSGMTLLMYAVLADDPDAVHELLAKSNPVHTRELLGHCVPSSGYVEFGCTGNATPLHAAMYFAANWKVAETLLVRYLRPCSYSVAVQHRITDEAHAFTVVPLAYIPRTAVKIKDSILCVRTGLWRRSTCG